MMSSKRIVLPIFIYLLFFLSANAGVGEEAISNFLQQKGIVENSVAVKILDLSTGDIIASHNSSVPLVPASIMKSVTTAALLQSVGPDYIYDTRVYIDGPIELGYLRGNLVIEGSCDPTINSDKEPYSPDFIEEICEVLAQKKINRIEGSVIIDETNFQGVSQPETWAKEDCVKYYGTGSHAFNFKDNSRGDNAVKDPAASFIISLKKQLEAKGIDLEDNDLHEGKRTKIFVHHSAPVDEIMRSCMMRSDNMFAESMLRTFSRMEGGDGSTNHATSQEVKLWKSKKLPLDGVSIVDGSGLSRANRMTANFMTEMLSQMSQDAIYASFFPLAGQEGTLRKFLAGSSLDSYIAMKTGSMRGIQCYAGYKLDEDYVPTHVIVIIMNDIPADRDSVKKAAENLLLTIFDNNK